ncbi:uncharacterized protein LOC108864279 [Galendromus occidentalis]|uniref:Uncharacterized protein LOC108864279 n=1 Tax=Galendromus occidentalis TaxID=34638 RepID=A0AAJ7L445_9ACAR|nr:uncharacterized protein LOC108864279 [Galendromus occidentalis]
MASPSNSNNLVSQRGKCKRTHDGHIYIRDKCSKDGTRVFWRCHHLGACKARLHTSASDDGVLKVLGVHSDEPNPSAVEVAAKRTALKRRAEECQETPLQLIESVFESSTQAAKLVLPSCETLSRSINRARKNAMRQAASPQDRSSIVIPEELTMYESEPGVFERFLIGDTGEGDPARILLFGRESVGEWIGLSRKIFVDVCYALLPDKSQNLYARMIQLIRAAWPAFAPEAISTDFEMGFVNAFTASFPDAETWLSVQKMKKKLGDLNLLSRYRNEGSFALSARMICALAFVPLGDLNNAIAELAVALPHELMPVLKYFEDTYVGSLLHILPDGTIIRREPLFPQSMWSVHLRTLNGDSRTNNYAEAAHRRLQTEFGVKHPNLWRFIEGLKRVQHHRDMLYARFESGNRPAAKRRKYEEIDRRVLELVNNFHIHTVVGYLRGCASNFVMNP